jgi:hypothetical protein
MSFAFVSRQAAFGLVGLAGRGVRFGVLSALLLLAGTQFTVAQALATCQ